MPYGDRVVSLYLPVTRWVFPGVPDYHPRYIPGETVLVSQGSFTADDWYGEYPGQCYGPDLTPKAGSGWETIDVKLSTELPTSSEALVGAAQGIVALPEDLPPEAGALRAELLLGNVVPQMVAGVSGALGAGRQNQFVLQRNGMRKYRLIVITRQIASERAFYVTFESLFMYPVNMGPGPLITRRR
jgi:hypothetical protein